MARRDVDLGFELQTLDDILTDGQGVAQADDVAEDLHVLKKAEQKRKKHGHRRTTHTDAADTAETDGHRQRCEAK